MRISEVPNSLPKFGRSRLSRQQMRRLAEHFVAGTPARTAAELIGIHRNSATLFFHRLREVIAAHLDDSIASSAEAAVEIEIGVHVFSGAGMLRPTRGAREQVLVIGLLKRGGRIRTFVPADEGLRALTSILRDRLDVAAVVYADRPAVCAALDALGVRHYGIGRGAPGLGRRAHISGVENFWSQAERHMRHYNGVPAHHFALFLQECEWRFNFGSPMQLLATLSQWNDAWICASPTRALRIAVPGNGRILSPDYDARERKTRNRLT